MKIKSLKHNFFMYFIRLFTSFGFTLFIFPIVARKLGVENLGKLQYVETIIAYFLLFVNLGILEYGKREVAIQRDDPQKLDKLVNELLNILYITTVLGSMLYYTFIIFFVKTYNEKIIFFIYSLYIVLNIFNVEWFYLGIEDQEYITKRNIFIKIVSSLLILIFIKDRQDIYTYVCILILGMAGSNIYNFFNLRNYIKFKIISIKFLKKHFKRLLYIFFSGIALSISYNLDSIMIKNMVGDIELGYYTLALKFGKMPLIIGTVVIGIFSPRLINYLGKGKSQEYTKLWNMAINIIFIFYFPIMIGMFILSEKLVLIFGGNEFLNAVVIFKIFSIYIFIMGFAVSTGVALDANRRDKEYAISVTIGSILNFFFNIYFINILGAVGAAIATIITESIAIIIRIILCRDIFIEIKLLRMNMLKILISSLFMGIFVYYINKSISNIFLGVITSIVLGGIFYFFNLLILKEDLIIEILKNKMVKMKK